VEIKIPFTAAAQQVTYQIGYAAPGLDFSNAVITWRVQPTSSLTTVSVHPTVQNGLFNGYQGYYAAPATVLSAANFPAGQFTNVVLDLTTVPGVGGGDAGADAGDAGDAGAAVPAVFDKSKVEALQLVVIASGPGAADILIDSVAVAGVTGTTGATFTAGAEGFAVNTYANAELIPATTPAVVAH